MGIAKPVRKITEWNPIAKRSKGRPKNRWKCEVLNDLKELKVKSWTYLVRDRNTRYKLCRRPKSTKGCHVSRSRYSRNSIVSQAKVDT
jgi:hypothetical protein